MLVEQNYMPHHSCPVPLSCSQRPQSDPNSSCLRLMRAPHSLLISYPKRLRAVFWVVKIRHGISVFGEGALLPSMLDGNLQHLTCSVVCTVHLSGCGWPFWYLWLWWSYNKSTPEHLQLMNQVITAITAIWGFTMDLHRMFLVCEDSIHIRPYNRSLKERQLHLCRLELKNIYWIS